MKINKIIFICVLSIALGVLFTIIYDILEPFLKTLGSKYLISGFWLMGAMVFGYIIRKPGSALKKMKINEIIFICVLSIAMGVFWWGYTFIYDILEPFLQPFGLKYLISGFWLMGAMFFGYIIRKPGSALLGELIPAFIQAFVARWGLTSILWGVVQGLPVELFFLALHYKKLSAGKMAIAGSLAAFASYFFDFFIKKYYYYTWQFNLIQLMGFVISGAVLGGFLAKLTADQLQATGVLNQFEITRDGK